MSPATSLSFVEPCRLRVSVWGVGSLEERLSIRDRLEALSRRELVALVGLAVVVVGGAGLWYARSLPKAVEVREARVPGSARAPGGGPAVTGSPSPSPSVLFVHVAGLVRHPGVYQFDQGQRVIDAVTAAGGARPKADLDLLNLAALLTDGEQILVPPHGAAPVAPTGGGSTTGGGTSGGLVDINSASETELEGLPGVGPVLAAAIIAYRTEHGPFPTVDALDDVSGIGPATLENLRPLVTV
jgi:competence protein ComEA